MTMFREAISAIPYGSQQAEATGFLPPIFRATGHIMYVIGALAEGTYNLTDEEALNELRAANAHLAGTVATIVGAPISAQCRSLVTAWVEAVRYAATEYEDWVGDDRGRNLKDLADRSAALASFLDAELAGVRGSDPGRTL